MADPTLRQCNEYLGDVSLSQLAMLEADLPAFSSTHLLVTLTLSKHLMIHRKCLMRRSASQGMLVAHWQAAGMAMRRRKRSRELVQVKLARQHVASQAQL